MNRTRLAFLTLAFATGCAGIIGVPDLTLDEDSPQGGPDASTPTTDGPIGTEAGPIEPDAEAGPPCDTSKLASDPLNCGRCGHDCVGGACKDGTCEPVALGTVTNAPLHYIAEYGDDLFVSTAIMLSPQHGGIWKLGKSPRQPVLYVPLRYARRMVVLGDTLYFVAYDYRYDDAGKEGGLWSCDLKGPTPCVPKLVSAAESPYAIATDKGKVYFTDDTTGRGLLQYAPPKPPVVFRQDYQPSRMYVDGENVFYVTSPGLGTNESGVLWSLHPDAGDATELTRYQKLNARGGDVAGNANALYFSAYDLEETTGGVVRRVARPGSVGTVACDYGGDKNKRPYGIHIDDKRVYWANQGDFAEPYANGSIATCELEGCCTDPTTLWAGSGEPVELTGDAKAIYWVTYRTGAVWKVAKP